jgi:hypothetical protein
MHIYEIRPRKDRRGFDLISDRLPFGRLWYLNVAHAVGLCEVLLALASDNHPRV